MQNQGSSKAAEVVVLCLCGRNELYRLTESEEHTCGLLRANVLLFLRRYLNIYVSPLALQQRMEM
jgi:hypothetical protein